MDHESPFGPPPEPVSQPAAAAELAPNPSQVLAPVVANGIEAPQYPDRSTGLTIFGVVQIILGLLAALMVPFVALSFFLSRLAPGGGLHIAQVISGSFTYALIAAALVTLGIGSMRFKRWARALTLVISWYWLITGTMGTVMLTAVMPATVKNVLQAQQHAAGQARGISDAAMAVILTLIIVFAAGSLIAVPITFVAFYGRRDVAETCRSRDPVERWTDRVPLPVLGAVVILAVQSLHFLAAGVSVPVFPLFGRYLTGIPGVACFFLLAFAEAALAAAFYWLKTAAWWIAVIVSTLHLFSMAFTYARTDMMQVYSKMGLSDEQMRVLSSSSMLRGNTIWWSLIPPALFLLYLLWLKRYFNTPRSAEGEALPAQL